ncbi:MAG TPA: hypothetical protein ENN68_07525 [Methanomicrobia archaeon]|nr:hypothetical protein [Methanomicrobia archaeon]
MCSDLLRYQVTGITILLLLCAAICGCGIVEAQPQSQDEPQQKPVIAITDLDFNNDGYINQIDLLILKSHFNDRYTRYVPWDLNADLRCDKRDFDYFAARIPLNYQYEVTVNISVWNMTNYTSDKRKNATMILDEVVYPQDLNRTTTWIKQYTSLEPPKNDDAVCVHYTRDLCRLAYKYLGPKTIAWGSSDVHTYGMIYTGGDWRSLSNWAIIDPYWGRYDSNFLVATGLHKTNSIHILLDEGRDGYWAITLSVDYRNNTVSDPYKAEYRIGKYRE